MIDWIIISLLSVLAIAGAVVACTRVRKPVPGLCPKCRYSLGPTPEITTCPECGSKPERVIVAQVLPRDAWRAILPHFGGCALAALSIGYLDLIGRAIADRMYTGPRVTESRFLTADAIFAGPRLRSVSLWVTIEQEIWPDGSARPLNAQLQLSGSIEPDWKPRLKVDFPPGPEVAQLQWFGDRASELVRTYDVPLDSRQVIEPIRLALARRAAGESIDVALTIMSAWFPGAISEQEFRALPYEARVRVSPNSEQIVGLGSSPERPGLSFPHFGFRNAQRAWSHAFAWPVALIQISLHITATVRTRMLFAPWPPK